jgi:hypothetical protein
MTVFQKAADDELPELPGGSSSAKNARTRSSSVSGEETACTEHGIARRNSAP